MGGFGSTRWNFHSKKLTADNCRTLSIFHLKRENLLIPGKKSSGSWIWRSRSTGEKLSSIGYELDLRGETPFLLLHYVHTSGWTEEKIKVDYEIPLVATTCHFGGQRYWFICPMTVNGRYCGRRVGKLYLAPGNPYFACRHCHNLTYRSSQESDKMVNTLKKMDTLELLQAINRGEVDFLKGWKALPRDLFQK